MGLYSKLDQSADLMNGMASRLGVDLGDAMVQHPVIEGYNYRQMVYLCASCTDQAGCAELQRGCTHLDAAPSYCENKDTLDARKGKRD